jgi:hypothetical protein
MNGRIYTGVNPTLEAEADRLLRESLRGVTKHSDKSDILTAWKEADRYKREVYVQGGVPDAATRKGVFHRVLNTTKPELNSRDGAARPRQGAQQAAPSHIYEEIIDDSTE